MGKYISEQVNNMEGNSTKTQIEPRNLFFVDSPNGNTVWSDIIGSQKAYELLLQQAGEAAQEGFYDRHMNLIHSFFRTRTFHPDLARMLGAPIDEVIPELQLSMHTNSSANSDANKVALSASNNT